MCVLLKALMFEVQSIKRLRTDFWSPCLEQKEAEVHQSVVDVTRVLCPGQFWPPSLSVCLRKLLGILFWHHGLKGMDGLFQPRRTCTESEKSMGYRLLGPTLLASVECNERCTERKDKWRVDWTIVLENIARKCRQSGDPL